MCLSKREGLGSVQIVTTGRVNDQQVCQTRCAISGKEATPTPKSSEQAKRSTQSLVSSTAAAFLHHNAQPVTSMFPLKLANQEKISTDGNVQSYPTTQNLENNNKKCQRPHNPQNPLRSFKSFVRVRVRVCEGRGESEAESGPDP